jgi:hypothetical protein
MLVVRPNAFAGYLCLAALALTEQGSAQKPTPGQKPTPASAPKVYSPVGAEEVWQPDTWKSYMTDELRPVIFARVAGTDGGQFRVQAMCTNEVWLELSIENETPKKVLRRTGQPRNSISSSTAGPFGSSIQTSTTTGGARSCVETQVRSDNSEVKKVVSETCDGDFRIDLHFKGIISKERYEQALKENSETSSSSARASGNIMDSIFGSSFVESMELADLNADDGNPRMDDILSAHKVRIGLPLEPDTFSTIDLHPQQSVFRTYVASCLSKAPKPAIVSDAESTAPTVAVAPIRSKLRPLHIDGWNPKDGLQYDHLDFPETFSGSEGDFLNALPNLLANALKTRGLAPDLFDSSIEDARKFILKCSDRNSAAIPECNTVVPEDHWWEQYRNAEVRHVRIMVRRKNPFDKMVVKVLISPEPEDHPSYELAPKGYGILMAYLVRPSSD